MHSQALFTTALPTYTLVIHSRISVATEQVSHRLLNDTSQNTFQTPGLSMLRLQAVPFLRFAEDCAKVSLLLSLNPFPPNPQAVYNIRLYASEPIKHPDGLEPPKTSRKLAVFNAKVLTCSKDTFKYI